MKINTTFEDSAKAAGFFAYCDFSEKFIMKRQSC